MSKTLVANPLWGLKGVPSRIILESKSLTIKNGILGGKAIPYENIASVEFSGANSLTLAGSITIIPYKGQSIKVDGFTRSQFKKVKQAVDDGYYEDDEDDGNGVSDDTNNDNDDTNNNENTEIPSATNSENEKILSMDVDIANEKELVKALYTLISTIEAKGERSNDVLKYNIEVRKR